VSLLLRLVRLTARSGRDLAEVLALLDRGEAVLIGVRSSEAYAEGHIPGALNIWSNDVWVLADGLPGWEATGRPLTVGANP
jgi:3-mercaptopyruvate sulfurtransferase SseA